MKLNSKDTPFLLRQKGEKGVNEEGNIKVGYHGWVGYCVSIVRDTTDSHDHLFFDCSFSQQVWSRLKHLACLRGYGSSFDSIVSILLPIGKQKSSKSCIGKLVVAAAAYFVWQEHNSRLFKNTKRSAKEVVNCVVSAVRLKLLSCHFKKTKYAMMFASLWEIPLSTLK
nr:hypothetical protein [Tanacetum cinerariifolium]